HALYNYGLELALEKMQENSAGNDKVFYHMQFGGSITAELKIQGNPAFADPILFTQRTISIIVINPFHIKRGIDNECGDWLQAETCNKVLSNKRWWVTGVVEDIREGSYTTTLKVRLDAPGVDVSFGEPLGASESGFEIT